MSPIDSRVRLGTRLNKYKATDNFNFNILKPHRNISTFNVKSKSRKLNVSDVAYEYFSRFHDSFKTQIEPIIDNSIEIFKLNYKEKLNIFYNFEDQIKELEILVAEETGMIQIIINCRRRQKSSH